MWAMLHAWRTRIQCLNDANGEFQCVSPSSCSEGLESGALCVKRSKIILHVPFSLFKRDLCAQEVAPFEFAYVSSCISFSSATSLDFVVFLLSFFIPEAHGPYDTVSKPECQLPHCIFCGLNTSSASPPSLHTVTSAATACMAPSTATSLARAPPQASSTSPTTTSTGCPACLPQGSSTARTTSPATAPRASRAAFHSPSR